MIRPLAICGPTASGKTAISLALAELFDAEIISCDSMQIYRGMDIGTAKADSSARARIPHHLIDAVSPREIYSTERYRREAEAAAEDIASRGKSVIFVGGTGLYLDTLTRAEQSEVPAADAEYRDRILAGIKTDEDKHALWERLRECDPVSAEAIHENNVRRVIRALEIYEKCGKPKSYFDKRSRSGGCARKIDIITLIPHNRELLYERIDKRVDEMMTSGLLAEVRALYESGELSGDTTASQAIGYKELVAYIKGECTLRESVDFIKQSSRRYAKRQLTWFRHVDSYEVYIDTEDGKLRELPDILSEISDIVKKINNI